MRIEGLDQIADLFGVTPKTIVEWQEQGLPVAVRGTFSGVAMPSQYDSSACIAWLVERETGKVRGENPRDRLARMQADAIEMDNAVKRRDLIPAAQIEPKMRAAIVSAREAWRNEPSRLSRMLGGKPPDEAEALLSQAFDAFLVRLSRLHTGGGPSDDDDDDDGTGTESRG